MIYFILMGMPILGFFLGRHRARQWKNRSLLGGTPGYYGSYVALWTLGASSLGIFFLSYIKFSQEGEEINPIFLGLITASSLAGAYAALTPSLQVRKAVERTLRFVFKLCAALVILMTGAIIFILCSESLRFFSDVSVWDFLTGPTWRPQMTWGSEDHGTSGSFGLLPLLTGSLLITFIALLIALPLGLFIALYMAEYMSPKLRTILKPAIELLAGVPTIVYGFFAVVAVAPFLQKMGAQIHLAIASESALGVGLVMGILIMPLITSLTDDALQAVPRELRDTSYALGATPSETLKKVLLPAALPGIMTGILLAISRAIGETMLVVMASGLMANLTVNPLASVTTITVQIVALLTGDQEFTSTKTLSAFALGLSLFFLTLVLNLIAHTFVKRYRAKYGP